MTIKDQQWSGWAEIRNQKWVVRGEPQHIMRFYKVIMRAQRLRGCKLSCLAFTKTKDMIISELQIAKIWSWGDSYQVVHSGNYPIVIGSYYKNKWLWAINLPKPTEIKRFNAAM